MLLILDIIYEPYSIYICAQFHAKVGLVIFVGLILNFKETDRHTNIYFYNTVSSKDINVMYYLL